MKQQNESQKEWEGHEVAVGVGMSFIFKYEMYLAWGQATVDIVNFLPDRKGSSGNTSRRLHRKCGFSQDWLFMTETVPKHTDLLASSLMSVRWIEITVHLLGLKDSWRAHSVSNSSFPQSWGKSGHFANLKDHFLILSWLVINCPW